jgi:predicted nucleotidyltransferase
MQSLEISILKVVTYFDIFSYPLTTGEIAFFLDKPVAEKDILTVITHLVKTKQLWQFNNFFSVRNEPGLAARRTTGNKLAIRDIKKARSVARFLSWIPYIKGIAISGSLSKNFADETSDLDFFIITAANRLWIVRIFYTFLFKMAGILNIKNWFCLNYFIDEIDFEIREHNLFTAVEIATLMPLKGEALFKDFFRANSWANEFLPNYTPNFMYLKDRPAFFLKRITEWLLNVTIANKLDNKIHSFFKKRYQRMVTEDKKNNKGLTIGAYEANKHACRPLAEYFQPKILGMFNDRFKIIKDKYYSEINKQYYSTY